MTKPTYEREWEFISENLKRMRVPDGWLVLNKTKVIHYDKGVTQSESMVFVPDPDYKWHLPLK